MIRPRLSSGFAILLGAFLASCQESLPARTDAEMAAKIVGTWIADADGMLAYMEKTYRPDGTSEGFLLDETAGRRVAFTSSWKINNGYLNGEVLTSTDPEGLPVGAKYSDKIVKVTNKRFVTIPEGYEVETVKRRKHRFFFF